MIYLTTDMFVLPNAKDITLEIWKILTREETEALGGHAQDPLLVLELPSILPDMQILHVACRCDPNPTFGFGQDTQIPFTPSPDSAIALFEISVGNQAMFGGTFALFVPRDALLRVVASELAAKAKATESSSLWGDLQAIIPTALIWQDWGPAISHIFPSTPRNSRWLTTTSGQRFTLSIPYGRHSNRLVVLDFNPLTVARVRHRMKALDDVLMAAVAGYGVNIEDNEFSIATLEALDAVTEEVPFLREHAKIERARGCIQTIRPADEWTTYHPFFTEGVQNELEYVQFVSKAVYRGYTGGTIIDSDMIIGLKAS